MPYNLLQFALRKRDAGGKTMSYDKALIAGKLRRWEKHLMRFRLPEWDEIPDFGLYMKQTVDLLRKSLLPHVWRVPSSKALSCKHERLFDLLTLTP